MKYLSIVIALYIITDANAKVITYQPPAEIKTGNKYIHSSKQYKVSLKQNGTVTECFVYSMDAPWKTNNCLTTAWLSFSFDAPVKVIVESVNYKQGYATVLPSSRNVKGEWKQEKYEFTIDKPGPYSVEFQKGIRIDHPLLIFANPIKEYQLDKTDTNLVYFGPGYHEIGEKYELKANQRVYIDGGAYVKGQFQATDQENIKIFGDGVLSGEEYPARSAEHMIKLKNCNNAIIEDITIIHAPRFMIVSSGENQVINNVKMMGWWFSTDGISSGDNSLIKNCFFKVHDDAIKLYRSGTTAENCVIWQMENGAPFQIGWNGNDTVSGFKAINCDVIRVEHEWDNENEAVFCAIHGAEGLKNDFLFENIRIENTTWRVFRIVTMPNRWGGWNPEAGNISNVYFKDIYISGEQRIKSLIKGHDQKHKLWNFTFENVQFNGILLTQENYSEYMFIDYNTVDNVVFKR